MKLRNFEGRIGRQSNQKKINFEAKNCQTSNCLFAFRQITVHKVFSIFETRISLISRKEIWRISFNHEIVDNRTKIFVNFKATNGRISELEFVEYLKLDNNFICFATKNFKFSNFNPLNFKCRSMNLSNFEKWNCRLSRHRLSIDTRVLLISSKKFFKAWHFNLQIINFFDFKVSIRKIIELWIL